jgi:hypothetical protein
MTGRLAVVIACQDMQVDDLSHASRRSQPLPACNWEMIQSQPRVGDLDALVPDSQERG